MATAPSSSSSVILRSLTYGEAQPLLDNSNSHLDAQEAEQRSCGAWFREIIRGRPRQVFLLCFLVFEVLGSFVYYSTNSHWEVVESIFYAVQIGLTCGYTVLKLETPFAKYFTVVYAVLGQSFISGTIICCVHMMVAEVEQSLRTAQKRSHLSIFGVVALALAYFLWIVLGTLWSMFYQRLPVAISILFAVSAMTGCGMVNPTDSTASYVFMIFYLLVGRPLHTYVFLLIARFMLKTDLLVSRTRIWLATYLVWFFGAMVFYLISNPHWDFVNTFFFIVSTGYLIGFTEARFLVQSDWEFIFTSVFLLVGSTIIMAGLFLFTKFIFHEISSSSAGLLESRGLEASLSSPDLCSPDLSAGLIAPAQGPTAPASHAEHVLSLSSDADSCGPGTAGWGGAPGFEGSSSAADGSSPQKLLLPPWILKWLVPLLRSWRFPLLCYLFVAYIGTQVAWSYFGYSLADALLFSFTTLATLGLYAPKGTNAGMVFTSIFCMVGVPVTLTAMATITRRFIINIDTTVTDFFAFIEPPIAQNTIRSRGRRRRRRERRQRQDGTSGDSRGHTESEGDSTDTLDELGGAGYDDESYLTENEDGDAGL